MEELPAALLENRKHVRRKALLTFPSPPQL
jgi:hypothetical protein